MLYTSYTTIFVASYTPIYYIVATDVVARGIGVSTRVFFYIYEATNIVVYEDTYIVVYEGTYIAVYEDTYIVVCGARRRYGDIYTVGNEDTYIVEYGALHSEDTCIVVNNMLAIQTMHTI